MGRKRVKIKIKLPVRRKMYQMRRAPRRLRVLVFVYWVNILTDKFEQGICQTGRQALIR